MNIIMAVERPESAQQGMERVRHLFGHPASFHLVQGLPCKDHAPDKPLPSAQEQGNLQSNLVREANRRGLLYSTRFEEKELAQAVLDTSSTLGGDLVVVPSELGTDPHSRDCVVNKVLAEATSPVLITRNGFGTHTGVLVTSHSPLDLKCLRSFITLHMEGLKRLVVVICPNPDLPNRNDKNANSDKPSLGLSERTLDELNRSLIDQLSRFGYEASLETHDQPFSEIGNSVIAQHQPDLIILPARSDKKPYDSVAMQLAVQLTKDHESSVLVVKN